MKVFKSFDEFVNESFVTEAKDSFKIKTDKADPNLGEVAVFKLVLREFDPQASLPQISVTSALAHPEFKKFADDTALIAFMDIAKERDPGFLTPRDLLKGAIIFKKLEGFDKTKATPLVKVGNFEVFDAKSAAQMKAGDKTAEEIKKDVEEIKKDPEFIPKPEEKTHANPEYVDVEKIEADADVIAFLKSKLLNGGDTVKFSKNSKKIVEIKATQTLISKFKRADKKTDSAAAAKVKSSGIDGIYGGGTSEGLGKLTADGKPKDSITSELITDIAKWCKLNGLDKPAVEKIFNEAKIDGDGGDNTPNPDLAGAKYYFVNKGWTYSEQTDPYKK